MKLNSNANGMLVNKKELAEIFGISERTFSEYQKDPEFPICGNGSRGESNQYDTAQVTRYLILKAEEKVKSSSTAFAEAKTEQALADASLKRLQVHEKLGNLIHKDEAILLLADWARYANQQFKEGFDRLIIDLQSEHDIKVKKEVRDKYVTITNERVRGFALKLGGSNSENVGAVSNTEDIID